MSLHLKFKPHSWYMGAAIKKDTITGVENASGTGFTSVNQWSAYWLNGMTGYIVDFEASTLRSLKKQIKNYVLSERERVNMTYKGVST